MPIIKVTTFINADIETCFDLARSIDLHIVSTKRTKEEAVAGIKTGMIGLREQVTWEANHFYIRQQLTTRVTGFKRPTYFRDEQVEGIFNMLCHDHCFRVNGTGTEMIDEFEFVSPIGILGRIADLIVLKRYLKKFLLLRNKVIKEYAESGITAVSLMKMIPVS